MLEYSEPELMETSNKDKPKLMETSNKDMMEHNEGEKRYKNYCLYTPMVFSNSASFYHSKDGEKEGAGAAG